MKWILIDNHKEALQEYHLIDNDDCKVILKFNPQQQSARISCLNQQRLFFIKNAGVLTGKYHFTNEYGLEIGHLSQDKRLGTGGTVGIDSKKYHYEITNNHLAEIAIYDSDSREPLITCSLVINDNKSSGISFAPHMSQIDNNSLLLALCWYLFLPVAKENVVEFAA
jgi:hypothetical protein